MKGSASPKVKTWLAEPTSSEVDHALARLVRSRDVKHVAVMPDVHLAKDVCNGVVVATSETLYPTAVGGDIGCGMAVLAFDAEATVLQGDAAAAAILSLLYRHVPSNKHRRETAIRELPSELAECELSSPRLDRLKTRDGRVQLGTLGRGNHFLELQRGEDGRLWLMIHSGSRGIGQAIFGHHLSSARSDSVLPYLHAESDDGRAYLHDHEWAVKYAEENRLRMAQAAEAIIEQVLGVVADWATFVQSNHNHVRREQYEAELLWVHRKGALPAHADVPGVVPGSMGTVSYHVTGRGNVDSLCSSSHGAGRRWSRSEARRKVSTDRLGQELNGVYYDHRMARRLCDEAPSAYKDIEKVMRAQRDLIRITRRVWPVLCYKGG